MEPSCVIQAARKCLGENRNGAAHHHRSWADEQNCERDVNRKTETAAAVRNRKGQRLHDFEEPGERDDVDADTELKTAIHEQQSRWCACTCCVFDNTSCDNPEQPITHRQPAQEDREHGSRGFAVRAKQGGEIFLPRDLIDEAAETGHYCEDQCNRSGHGSVPAVAVVRYRAFNEVRDY